MAKDGSEMGINTRLAHSGNNPRDYFGFVNPPVVHASTVLYPDAATMAARSQKYTYGTRGTPTTDALALAIDALEGSAGTIVVPSGLAAVTVPLLAFLSAGDHLLIVDSVYHPTRNFADTMLKRLGIEVEYYDPHVGAGIAALIKSNTKVVFTESPASNTFEVQDIPAIAKVAHAAGAVVMMDNTWATPLYFRPLDHGVDISIHAATKYPAGHSDVLLGTVSATAACWKQLCETFYTMGCCAGPDDVYQVLRGLRTMGVRL
ncbi:MAG: cystathionine beta-lyase, partial [Mesorhizobium sp.]